MKTDELIAALENEAETSDRGEGDYYADQFRPDADMLREAAARIKELSSKLDGALKSAVLHDRARLDMATRLEAAESRLLSLQTAVGKYLSATEHENAPSWHLLQGAFDHSVVSGAVVETLSEK